MHRHPDIPVLVDAWQHEALLTSIGQAAANSQAPNAKNVPGPRDAD